jgi:hypothetical protein
LRHFVHQAYEPARSDSAFPSRTSPANGNSLYFARRGRVVQSIRGLHRGFLEFTMSADPNGPVKPTPMTTDQFLAEMLRENERLRRQLEDAQHERDQIKKLYLETLSRHAEPLTPEDLAGAIPARPVIEQLIQRLEKR